MTDSPTEALAPEAEEVGGLLLEGDWVDDRAQPEPDAESASTIEQQTGAREAASEAFEREPVSPKKQHPDLRIVLLLAVLVVLMVALGLLIHSWSRQDSPEPHQDPPTKLEGSEEQ